MLTQTDLQQLVEKGITPEMVQQQLNAFSSGFPYLDIVSAASTDRGIVVLSPQEQETLMTAWLTYIDNDGTVCKFVPASGAASRMFKDLYAFLDADYHTPTTAFEQTFFDNLNKFAFYESLDSACKRLYAKEIRELLDEHKYKKIVKALLSEEGLDYGNKPKGLLLFHSYPEGNRTPVGEQLSEGALYAKDSHEGVHIHFTVSSEHINLFDALLAARKSSYGYKLGADYDITYSIQKPSTDTIAVDANNQPFRDSDGSLLFRPGGHGALIQNLNEMDSDVVFIKNIDNVIPDAQKPEEARWKKILAGLLVTTQQKAFDYLYQLEKPTQLSADDIAEMLRFVHTELCIDAPNKFNSNQDAVDFLKTKLNRPFRVCGMVKNVGEPGGGPFLVKGNDGAVQLQILESSQIDANNPEAVKAFKQGSHFNPVDLVCGLRNYKGEKFDLPHYVDPATGFISHKSKDGKELKALELPGLWNGAMSNWNTIFVEVPISTFNPVKTVNDLLRKEHQNSID